MILSDVEQQIFRLSRERKLCDREIAEVLNLTREWVCKLRRRTERKVGVLNQFLVTPGRTVDALSECQEDQQNKSRAARVPGPARRRRMSGLCI
jgi:hypothetical protein